MDWSQAILFLASPAALGSQKAVAEALDIRPQMVSDIANQKTKKVDWELGERIRLLGEPYAKKAKAHA